MSAALKTHRTGWINTWLYISCGYNQGIPALSCNSWNNVFNFNNNYGFFRRWVSLLAKKTKWKHVFEHAFRIQSPGISAPTSGRQLISFLKSRTRRTTLVRTYTGWKTITARANNGFGQAFSQSAP